MSNFSALKTAIQNAIKQNGNQEITGNVLQNVLISIIETLGDSAINTLEIDLSNLSNLVTGVKNNVDNGYVYAGIATPSTTPVSGKVFYVAIQAGTYTNFGNTDITQGINILKYNGSVWSNNVVIAIDDEPNIGRNNLVKSGGTASKILDINFKTFGLNSLPSYLGNIEDNGIITAYSNARYKIVPINGGDVISIYSTPYTRIAILKEFVENPEIPYTLVYATGEGRRQTTSEINVTAPSDAKYVLVQTEFNSIGPMTMIKFDINGNNGLIGINYPIELLRESYTPYFSSDKTFGLTDSQDISLLRNGLIKCVFYEQPEPAKLGIYSYQITGNNFVFWIANCDNIQGDALITSDDVFCKVSEAITQDDHIKKFFLKIGETNIGYIIVDLSLIRKSKSYVTSSTPSTYNNSFLSVIDLATNNSHSCVEDLYFSKSATSLKIYKRIVDDNYIMYPLNYRNKSYTADQYPSFYDNWGIGVPYLCTYDGIMNEIAPLFNGAEAELAMTVPDEKDGSMTYVGGSAHGFENITLDNDNVRNIRILINGVSIGETDTINLTPVKSVEVYQESQLVPAYSNSNPFATIFKEWTFDNDGLKITTKIKFIRTIQVGIAYIGMFGVFRHWNGSVSDSYLTNRAIKSNEPFITYNVSDNWESDPSTVGLRTIDKNCTEIKMYGEKNMGFALKIINANTHENGGMSVRTNGNQSYNKIYYAVTGAYLPSINDELYGTQIWEIL